MSKAFLPPIEHSPVQPLVSTLLPWVFNTLLDGLSVHIDEQDIERLKTYREKRLLLLPNHPAKEDPYVMFELSRRVDRYFNYVAAREIFDDHNGLQGWLLQRCGVYSVIRGKSDRESFRTTKNLLVAGLRWLVIFIEGEVSHENDKLIPFEPGVIQLAFWALEELHKKQPDEVHHLYVAPVANKYFLKAGYQAAFDQSFNRLAKALDVELMAGSNFQRIHQLGDEILKVQERQLGVTDGSEQSFDTRIGVLKNRLLSRMEAFLELPTDSEVYYLDRLRAVRNRMDALIYTYDDSQTFSQYEERMNEHLIKTFDEFYTDLNRLVNFLTYREGYLQEDSSPERVFEFLLRMEKEVFGSPKISHPRTVVMQVGQVFDLADRYDAYLQDKKHLTQAVAAELEANTGKLLYQAKPPA